MSIRVYIDGYERTASALRGGGVSISRELENYASVATFALLLPYADARPEIGEHVLIRDDVQLLRNSNRLTQIPWITTDVDAPTATWGTLPTQVGGNGLRWEVTENATDGYIHNYTQLVEHPLTAFGAQTGALETRYFVYSMFLEKEGSTHDVTIQAQTWNGTAATSTSIDFDVYDGTFAINSGTGSVIVDSADAGWWRVIIVETLSPAPSATVMPTIDLYLQPHGSCVTCCWQISEVTTPPAYPTWDEATETWDEATETWDDFRSPLSQVPAYLDRRNVSPNELLGIITERDVSWFSRRNVRVSIIAVDYRAKMRRTLVTEAYSSQTDQAIITDLLSTYAPYLAAEYSGTAVSGLSFAWVKKPLDQCLDDISAQSGDVFWRILPEAVLQYGPARVDSVGYTFGDSHNLIEWSNDPSTRSATAVYDSGWFLTETTADADLTIQEIATPYSGSNQAWLVADSTGASLAQIRANTPLSGDGPALTWGGQKLGTPRTYAAGIFVKKGSATNTVVSLQIFAAGYLNTRLDLNATTGEITGGDFLTPVQDADGGEWFLLEGSVVAPIDTQIVGFTFHPAYSATIGGSDSAALTGSAIVCHAYMQFDAKQRYVKTEAYTAYEHDNTNWNLEVSGISAADLANVITVQSDEAGTYAHTATDSDSVAIYGSFEILIIDNTLGSNTACQNRAETELTLKAWPRESAKITCWYKTNLDVGMLAVVAQEQLLQSHALGQVIQRYERLYRNAADDTVTLELAPFNNDRVVKSARAALATA